MEKWSYLEAGREREKFMVQQAKASLDALFDSMVADHTGRSMNRGGVNAKQLIDAVRRRRGLYVQEKVVEKATKQRTLARKV